METKKTDIRIGAYTFNDVTEERADASEEFHRASGAGELSSDDTVTLANGRVLRAGDFVAMANSLGAHLRMGMDQNQLRSSLNRFRPNASQVSALLQVPTTPQEMANRAGVTSNPSAVSFHLHNPNTRETFNTSVQPAYSFGPADIGAKEFCRRNNLVMLSPPGVGGSTIIALRPEQFAQLQSSFVNNQGNDGVRNLRRMVVQ